MEAPRRTRRLNRDKSVRSEQAPRGAKQIVIPMTRQEYDELWGAAVALRAFLEELCETSPELFPQGFQEGCALHGCGRESRKLQGVRLRKIVLRNGASYWLRPGFVLGYMAGTVDDVSFPLLLASYGIPAWLLTRHFGHSDMYWQRLTERLGRSNLVGTTVADPARLPDHISGDEHHVDWNGKQGYVAVTAAEGCVLGMALTQAADDRHLAQAYGDFAAEARELKPEYAPQTASTDGWTPTQNAFKSLLHCLSL